MSRVGKKPIPLPKAVNVRIQNGEFIVKGPKAELSRPLPEGISVDVSETEILVRRSSDEPKMRALHGLWRTLISNMITGVTSGFEKRLQFIGTGYRVQKQGKGLQLSIGFSHQVFIEPIGLNELAAEGVIIAVVSGPDKETVGEQAARIRKLRKPNPFTGKGIKYSDEVVRRKPGKAGKAAAGAG